MKMLLQLKQAEKFEDVLVQAAAPTTWGTTCWKT